MQTFLLLALLFSLLVQGGFYPIAYLIVGIAGAVLFAFSRSEVRISKTMVGLGVLSLIYLLSSILRGMSFGTFTQALRPLMCLVFFGIVRSLEEEERRKLLENLTKLGILSAIAGILMYVGGLELHGVMHAGRLQFTFQYANAAGTWFAVCFLLAERSENRKIRMLSLVDLAALLLTKSLGAIIILFALQTISWVRRRKQMDKKEKHVLLAGYGIAVSGGGVILWQRGGQAFYTFLERGIQSYDGCRMMLANVGYFFMGTGAGNWKYIYPYYQSAQYKAGVIHNSYMQVGVSAGILAMLLLVAFLVSRLVSYGKVGSRVNEAMVMILLHSVMDYCLSFFCIDLLLVILAGAEPEEKDELHGELRAWSKCMIGILIACIGSFGWYGAYQVRSLQDLSLAYEPEMQQQMQARLQSTFLKNGYEVRELYTEYLYRTGQDTQLLAWMKEQSEIQTAKEASRSRSGTSASAKMEQLLRLAELRSGKIRVDDVIETLTSQPYQYDFIQMLNDQIRDSKLSHEDIKKYDQALEGVNRKIKERPAVWLNNQKEIQEERVNEK